MFIVYIVTCKKEIKKYKEDKEDKKDKGKKTVEKYKNIFVSMRSKST